MAKAARCSFCAASLVCLPFIHGTASCALLKILSGEIVVMVRLGRGEWDESGGEAKQVSDSSAFPAA